MEILELNSKLSSGIPQSPVEMKYNIMIDFLVFLDFYECIDSCILINRFPYNSECIMVIFLEEIYTVYPYFNALHCYRGY